MPEHEQCLVEHVMCRTQDLVVGRCVPKAVVNGGGSPTYGGALRHPESASYDSGIRALQQSSPLAMDCCPARLRCSAATYNLEGWRIQTVA